MKEILFYGFIGTFSAEMFINDVSDSEGKDITVRINSGGGDVQAGFGIIAKFQEFKGIKKIKVDGKAYSMAAFTCLYADNVEALDVSDFMFHRAAFPEFIENNKELFTDEMKAMLKRTNDDLRKAFEAKIDLEKFKEITGTSVDELFSMDSRVDVFLTSNEAKQVNLINKINKITPERSASIAAGVDLIAASYGEGTTKGVFIPEKVVAVKKEVKKINKKMDLNELKAKHPELFAEAKTIGAKEEKNRVQAWLEFSEIDPEAVSTGVESGEGISALDMSKFSKKVMMKATVTGVEGSAAEPVKTTEPKIEEPTKENKAVADFETELYAELEIETK